MAVEGEVCCKDLVWVCRFPEHSHLPPHIHIPQLLFKHIKHSYASLADNEVLNTSSGYSPTNGNWAVNPYTGKWELVLHKYGYMDEIILSFLVLLLVLFSFYRLWLVWAYKLNFREATAGPQGWDLLVNWVVQRVQIRKKPKFDLETGQPKVKSAEVEIASKPQDEIGISSSPTSIPLLNNISHQQSLSNLQAGSLHEEQLTLRRVQEIKRGTIPSPSQPLPVFKSKTLEMDKSTILDPLVNTSATSSPIVHKPDLTSLNLDAIVHSINTSVILNPVVKKIEESVIDNPEERLIKSNPLGAHGTDVNHVNNAEHSLDFVNSQRTANLYFDNFDEDPNVIYI